MCVVEKIGFLVEYPKDQLEKLLKSLKSFCHKFDGHKFADG